MPMKNPILSSCKKILSVFLTTILLLSITINPVHAQAPKISIIVPVYNVSENLLRNCLNSAKNQTLKDIEVICVDDGSTNGSGKVLDEYAKNDPRFIVVHQENGGTCVARDRGMELARGEYIQFLDHDDTIDPTMSEKCYKAAKEHDADIVKCGFSDMKNKHKFINFSGTVKCCKFYPGFNAYIWNGLYKRCYLTSNDINFKMLTAFSEDEIFNLLTIIQNYKIVYISQILYNHTKHQNNQASVILAKNESRDRLSHNLSVFCNKLKNKYPNSIEHKKFLFELTKYRTSASYFSLIQTDFLQDDVVNLLPLQERMQIRNIIQAAKSCD